MNLILFDKFDKIILKNKSNNLFIDEIRLDSCRKILDEKIKISKDIKKYVKYAKYINDGFIKSFKIGNIKNIDILKIGAYINAKDVYTLPLSTEIGQIDVLNI